MADIPFINVTIRVKTRQDKIADECIEGFPLRRWSFEVCMLDKNGKEVTADIIQSCAYYLHSSFTNPIRSFKNPPFRLEEEGWGQFDCKIACQFIFNGGQFSLNHKLIFSYAEYAIDFNIKVPVHIPELQDKLKMHFDISHAISQETTEEYNVVAVSKWLKKLPTMDEDVVSEIVDKVLQHPAIKSELNNNPINETFKMDVSQFPNDLLEEITDFMSKLNN
ncbi:hypothetical protein Kpol_530p10 [Vanderwaltozyma polyspora DSM 70294]|uniref:YEATS domain-containing protein n=1 Tax=Vanderwaltozyma polyspora (strain ATCC 22028 / DSM 70294 / BCRC 21397 / CBS 2163 / NBRC 10782 / NRRL Y-8283 / UCD 57-17) TaxID=436907 RepID=A7TKY4_VANPO|nr:uncharacterized protein Kpol_530p10 [Vanderwaltozyma polyspora DSM 70294]EDO17040.1 hypothetical protein Kpol_530p10 [Vanderwaltozyma polyspora DSM 70294]